MWHPVTKLATLVQRISTIIPIVIEIRREQVVQRRMLENIMSAQDDFNAALQGLQSEISADFQALDALVAQITQQATAQGVPNDVVVGWTSQLNSINQSIASKLGALPGSTGAPAPAPTDPNAAGADVDKQEDIVQDKDKLASGLRDTAKKTAGKGGGNPGVDADTTT